MYIVLYILILAMCIDSKDMGNKHTIVNSRKISCLVYYYCFSDKKKKYTTIVYYLYFHEYE